MVGELVVKSCESLHLGLRCAVAYALTGTCCSSCAARIIGGVSVSVSIHSLLTLGEQTARMT